MWWLFVQLHETGSVRICFVCDRSSAVELEQGGGVYLTEFALCRSKSPFELEGGCFCRRDSGTLAEELSSSVKLSMDF